MRCCAVLLLACDLCYARAPLPTTPPPRHRRAAAAAGLSLSRRLSRNSVLRRLRRCIGAYQHAQPSPGRGCGARRRPCAARRTSERGRGAKPATATPAILRMCARLARWRRCVQAARARRWCKPKSARYLHFLAVLSSAEEGTCTTGKHFRAFSQPCHKCARRYPSRARAWRALQAFWEPPVPPQHAAPATASGVQAAATASPQSVSCNPSDSDSDSDGSARRGGLAGARPKPRVRRARGCFTAADDERLRGFVVKFQKDWTRIAKDMQLSQVDAKKCRDRYNNYAHPELDPSPCRAEEVLLFIELHKRHGNKWTEIASEMNAAAAAAAEPGAKTRRSENWVKNAFYSKKRKSNKDEADTRWAPLYAYQEACQAEGRDLLSEGGAAGAAQLPGAEAAEPLVAQRRSSRVTRKPCYGDFESGEELEEEDDEEEEEEEQEEELQPQPQPPAFQQPLWTWPSLLPPPAPEHRFIAEPSHNAFDDDFDVNALLGVSSDEEWQRMLDCIQPAASPAGAPWGVTDEGVLLANAADQQAEQGPSGQAAAPAPASAEAWFDNILAGDSDVAALLPMDGLLAPAPPPPSAEQDCTLSANEPDCDAPCPSLAHSARSDGAAGSAAPQACLTPESVRNSGDPRDCILVVCEPLLGDEVAAVIAAHEQKVQRSLFYGGEMLSSPRGVLYESMEAGRAHVRAQLDAVSAHVHQRWPSVQCLVLVLRIGALNEQELAGCVHVGGLSKEEHSAALRFAKAQLQALLN